MMNTIDLLFLLFGVYHRNLVIFKCAVSPNLPGVSIDINEIQNKYVGKVSTKYLVSQFKAF